MIKKKRGFVGDDDLGDNCQKMGFFPGFGWFPENFSRHRQPFYFRVVFFVKQF